MEVTPDERTRLLALQPGETTVLWREIEPPPVWTDGMSIDDELAISELTFTEPPVQPGDTFGVNKRVSAEGSLMYELTILSVVPCEDEGRVKWKVTVGR